VGKCDPAELGSGSAQIAAMAAEGLRIAAEKAPTGLYEGEIFIAISFFLPNV